MSKILIGITLLLALSSLSQAQDYFEESRASEEPTAPFDRVYFGGGFSFNLFGDFKFVNVAPQVGYRFTKDFSMGLGASYIWLERDFAFFGQPSFKVSSSQFGGRVFGRYQVTQEYFLQTEFESLSVELGTGVGNETAREWVPGFFVGGGMITPFFANASVNITVLYNLLHDSFRSPYNSAVVIRGGFML